MVILGLIPAFNCEETIGPVVVKAKEYCNDVIVYNDGSKDSTGEIACLCGAKVIEANKNRGKGYALKMLFSEVGDEDVVTIDGDGQHDPKEIPKLIENLKYADVVIGRRDKLPLSRRILNRLANGSNVKDIQSGFRAYSANAVKNIKITTNGFGVDAQILESLKDMKIVSVPISVKYNEHSHSKNIIVHALEIASYNITNNSLVYLCIPGIVVFLISVLGLGNVITLWEINHQLALGTMLFSMTSMVISVIGFFTGVILRAIHGQR